MAMAVKRCLRFGGHTEKKVRRLYGKKKKQRKLCKMYSFDN